MSNDNNGNDEETKHDLTRVEDLSEFLHQDDPEADAIFQEAQEEEEELPPPFEFQNSSIDDLEDSDDEAQAEEHFGEAEQSFDDDTSDDFSDEPTVTDFDMEDSLEETQDDQESFDEELPDLPGGELEESDDFLNDSEDFDSFEDENTFEENSEEVSVEFDDAEAEQFEQSEDEDYQEDFQDDFQEEPLEEESLEGPQEEIQAQFQDDDAEEAPLEQPEITEAVDLKEIEVAPIETQQVIPDIATTPAAQRESFSEVRDFANNMSYGTVKVGGNPAFSLLLRDIVSDDCHESIIAILNEHGLLGSEENLIRTSLEIGHLLIPQISEFSAIYLAGKLRKYARDVQIGLAQEIHDSKSYDSDSKGMVTKRSIFQNKDLSFKRSQSEFNPEEVLSSTQSKLSGYEISKHLGIVSASGVYDLGDLTEQTLEYETEPTDGEIEVGSSEIYSILLKTLKNNAFHLGANAVVSVNYTMTPIQEENTTRYNIICTGDAVILD